MATTPIPVIPLREQVMFPGVVMILDVEGEGWARLAEESAGGHVRRIILATQTTGEPDRPVLEDLVPIGVESEVIRVSATGDKSFRVIVRGLERRRLLRFVQIAPYVTAEVAEVEEHLPETAAFNELVGQVRDRARKFIEISPDAPREAIEVVDAIDSPNQLADRVAAHLGISVALRTEILGELDVEKRLKLVLTRLEERITKLEGEAAGKPEPHADPAMRERVLRERLHAIQEELGEASDDAAVEELRRRLDEAKLPEGAREHAQRELRRLRGMEPNAPEYGVTRTYLEWLADLPWSKKTEDKVALAEARAILDADHQGLGKIKKRVLQYLAVRKLKPDKKGPILLFHGPPGVGKTSLAKSIARALGRELVRVSLGGVHDEAAIRGHRRTYVGAIPGRIITALKQAGTRNPVIVLDELDKMGADFRGDPASAMLEVLDPEQNWSFSDHYIETPFDLSEVIFIATANDLGPIPAPLRDRMEIIELAGYTPDEKRAIARKHLVTKQLLEHGLTAEHLGFSDAALDEIASGYTREAGVRTLERQIASVVRAYAVKIAAGEDFRATVEVADVHAILGAPRFDSDIAEETEQPGVVTGLAWTPNGGEILFVEASRMPGQGKLVLTGQLGDVMKESAQAALSYVRSHAPAWGLPADLFLTSDFHLHFPAGGIPKDGPSAGQALVTAIVSLVTDRPVRGDVAMTGEITLRGNVLPVGGISSKVLAAHRAGIKTVILPERNRKDAAELPAEVKDALEIVFVKKVDETINLALVPVQAPAVREIARPVSTSYRIASAA